MLGLGSSIVKGGAGAKTIVTDNLVLKHNYDAGRVHQVGTGAASLTASSTDYIDFSDVCDLSTTDFSICFWAYVTEATSQNFISKFQDSNNRWFIRTNDSDVVQFYSLIGGGNNINHAGSTTLSSHTWYHIAVTCDRSDGSTGTKIYVNGVLDVQGDANAVDHSNTGPLHIGLQDTTYIDDSYICNVGIWINPGGGGSASAILSPAQIKSIMWKNYADLTTSEKSGSNLLSWWNLSENANDNHGSNNGTLS